MHTTRLHRQIVNRVGLIVVVLAFLVAASCIGVMHWLYHKSDADQVAAGLGKVELLLHNERDELGRAVRDYAVWNDAYEYMSRPNLKFETDNFTQQSLNVMQLDFVAMMTAPDQVLFSSEINSAIPDPKTTPAINSPSLLSLLAKLPDWQKSTNEGTYPRSYLTFLNGRPLLLAVSGIFDSLQKQPYHGLMIFGRYLDGSYLQRLQQFAESRLQLSVQRPENPASGSSVFHSEATASKRLTGWLVPEFWLQVSTDINWPPRYLAMALFTGGLLLVLSFASWSLQHLLNRLVVARIETFADLAWRRKQGERVYWPVEGQNELDLLARTFNELMDEVQSVQKNMYDLSITDPLTSLGNRRGMEEHVGKMMTNCQLGASLSMLLMDLDGFKLINDSLGHAAGDLLLQEVAQRMRQVMRRQDKLFRLGGDEFAVLMPHTTAEHGQLLAQRLLKTLDEPIHLGTTSSVSPARWGWRNGTVRPMVWS